MSGVTRLIIMAAGMSSRMRNSEAPAELSAELVDQANSCHKSMIRLGKNGEPFLHFILHHAAQAGITDVALVVSADDRSIQDYYRRLNRSESVWGLRLYFIPQSVPAGRVKPAGTADAVVQVLDALPEWEKGEVLVCNADNLYSVHAFRTMTHTSSHSSLLSYEPKALGYCDEKLTKMGIVVAEEGRLVQIVEKPSLDQLNRLQNEFHIGVSMSVFRFLMPEAAPYLRSLEFDPIHNEKILANAVGNMLRDGVIYEVESIAEYLPDLTTKSDILAVQKYLQA